jgi:glyoxylase-like metal-dependent hydrolase (beta-lactamase superfamily II)
MVKPINLGNDVYLIDLFDLGMAERTGSYVLQEDDVTIIETSASPSIPHLLNGLEQLQVNLEKIKYIIVTHIHLDHAGGVGLFLEKCPNAKVVVHPRGKRHLINPTRLIAGARAVYGEAFDSLFNPILPVPEDRLITMEDGETLTIGEDRKLTFYDTPGHAKHHFSIYDSKSKGIFSGDTIGILYTAIKEFDFVLPTTSPNQFHPDEMLASLEKIEKLEVEKVYFGHYGMSSNPQAVYDQMRKWVPYFVEVGERILHEKKDDSFAEKSQAVAEELGEGVESFLTEKGYSTEHEVFNYLKLDLQVCAMGIVDYLEKK